MIWTIVQTSWRRLRNNRAELLLTFVVPVVFFSIFALIFGSRDSSSKTPKIKIAVCVESTSTLAKKSAEILEENSSLRTTRIENTRAGRDVRKKAEDLVRRGMVSAAVILAENQGGTEILVMSDSFDPVASQLVTALVQRSVMTASVEQSQNMAAHHVAAVAEARSMVMPASHTESTSVRSSPFKIESVDVLGAKKSNPVIAMYAAGIAVMFLLFSATTASGSLLEERENSTLDRLLCSRLTMDHLLMGKWLYLTLLGILQTTLMFCWGSLIFGVSLWEHLDGFIAMTCVTAGAASSFALMLASMCRSRVQLGWISTIIILAMSALGGSMVPRYLMSESIQKFGLITFNAWALDGYQKVFWRELPMAELRLEISILLISAFAFIVLARLFSLRWERW